MFQLVIPSKISWLTFSQILLWSVTLPSYLILLASRIEPALTTYDLIISRVLMGLVVVEYFADQQQWDYHKAKHEYQKTAKVPTGWVRSQLERGFNTTGLWKYSRHPNFAAEQTIWVILYQWGCFASGTMYNWTAVGMIGYLLVFQGSTPLTEGISGGKYPEYKLYQERVGKFLPSILGKGWNEEEAVKIGPKYVEAAKKKAANKSK
jgi:steroid 5-alpha reductase family enzyme